MPPDLLKARVKAFAVPLLRRYLVWHDDPLPDMLATPGPAQDVNTSKTLTVDGLSTEVLLAGPPGAPGVLLLHGGGIDRARMCWHETMPALAGRYRLIAPDLPGYGGTEGFGRPHGVAELGRWAEGVLRACGAGPVAVIGCSMGGATALWLALERPDLVRAVVPISSYGLARKAMLQPLVALWPKTGGSRVLPTLAGSGRFGGRLVHSLIFADPRRISPEMVASFRSEAAAQRQRQSFRDFLRCEAGAGGFASCFADRLGSLTQPAMFIHGRFDMLVGCRHARRAAALAPRAALLTVPAGHWPQRERPEVVGPALLDFLDRHWH